MEDMKMLAMSVASVFLLAFGVAADAPSKAATHDLLGAEPLSEVWCTGHVRSCTAEGLGGVAGCIDAEGKGGDAETARKAGILDCNVKLRGVHRRTVTCTDASLMTCR